MTAHESQLFEWLPWTQDEPVLQSVPKSDDERLEWLASNRKYPVNDAVRKSLIKWYGEKQDMQVKNAEAFEICEYGMRPTDEQIRKLFPMLGK